MHRSFLNLIGHGVVMEGNRKMTDCPDFWWALYVLLYFQAALARSSFKRIKTLRHPNILTFLDGIEVTVIFLITMYTCSTYLQIYS